MHRIIIPGPPGTGKTHRLMHYLDEELKKTDPEKIAYIAFSNAAVDVARERIKNDKVYIAPCTLWAHKSVELTQRHNY